MDPFLWVEFFKTVIYKNFFLCGLRKTRFFSMNFPLIMSQWSMNNIYFSPSHCFQWYFFFFYMAMFFSFRFHLLNLLLHLESRLLGVQILPLFQPKVKVLYFKVLLSPPLTKNIETIILFFYFFIYTYLLRIESNLKYPGPAVSTGGLTAVVILVSLVLLTFGWIGYAYFYPHTWSGQILIKV